MKKIAVCLFSVIIVYTVSCKKNSSAPVPPVTPPVDTTHQDTVPVITTPVNDTVWTDSVPTVWYDNDNMLLGNPDSALPVTYDYDNYLIRTTYNSESYNRDRGIPNWVSWHLYQQDIGSAPRQDDFRPNTTLPAGWYEVQDASYTGSGFDRGHNCPSGDRTSTTTANSSTFLMTNIIPQAPNNNQRPWDDMENYIRTQVNTGMEAYVIMGNYGTGGDGNFGSATTIDNGHVTVPAHIWKVVVLLANGNNDTARITVNTRVIAVDMPNSNSVNSNWKTYRTSVDAIEAATGYNLLSRLPVDVQNTIETKVDNQ